MVAQLLRNSYSIDPQGINCETGLSLFKGVIGRFFAFLLPKVRSIGNDFIDINIDFNLAINGNVSNRFRY